MGFAKEKLKETGRSGRADQDGGNTRSSALLVTPWNAVMGVVAAYSLSLASLVTPMTSTASLNFVGWIINIFSARVF